MTLHQALSPWGAYLWGQHCHCLAEASSPCLGHCHITAAGCAVAVSREAPPVPEAARIPKAGKLSGLGIHELRRSSVQDLGCAAWSHSVPWAATSEVHRPVWDSAFMSRFLTQQARARKKTDESPCVISFKRPGPKSYVLLKQIGGSFSLSKHFTILAHALYRGLLLPP